MASEPFASILELPGCCCLTFRGDRVAADIAGSVFGVALPDRPCRASHADHRAALWLGRDEWLLLASASETDDLVASLTTMLAETPHALVDVSDASVGLEIHGPGATDLLSAGCPLDFDLSAFPVDMCTRTLYGKVEIVLWRKQFDRFRIDVRRSFLPYMQGLLSEVLREQASDLASA